MSSPPALQPPGAYALRGWAGPGYGLLGLPLAFVALPLYIALPSHYAQTFGLPLAWVGLLLLGARVADALCDPWIGRWADACFGHSRRRVLSVCAIAAAVMSLGFAALFLPAVERGPGLLVWLAVSLVITYLAYSVLSVTHQAWGARLGGDETHRARVVSWREGFSIVGVLLASVLPTFTNWSVTAVVLSLLLLGSWAALHLAPLTTPTHAHSRGGSSPEVSVWSDAQFRRLLGLFLLNGIASAIPATLVLFFIRDQLQARALEPVFLGTYFAAAALSIPLWNRWIRRVGLVRAWLTGMVLSIACFVGAAALGAGDVWAYAAICAGSGLALGADLVAPPALLAGLIEQAGQRGRAEGRYFGWWNFATKLNLALAAGLALPLLGVWGYAPGRTDPAALLALTAAYCVLPCVLKAAAAACLVFQLLRS